MTFENQACEVTNEMTSFLPASHVFINSAAESTSDFVVVVVILDALPKMAPLLAGNGLPLQPRYHFTQETKT